MDKAHANEFFQSCLRETFDIHSVPAHKQCERFDLFRLTFWIRAVQSFNAVGRTDLCSAAADRTDRRNFQLAASRQVLFDLRDDHISLVDTNHITDAEFQAFQDT